MANSWPKWKRRAPHIKERLEAGATIQELANEYDVSPKSITNRIGELKADGLLGGAQEESNAPKDSEVEMMSNGTHKSRKLLTMSEEQSKDPEYLLKAHGYSVDDWELINFKSKIWNVYSKVDKVQTLYSSSITARPKAAEGTYEEFVQSVVSEVEPVDLRPLNDKRTSDYMLEVALYDMHFGNSDYEFYKDTQRRVARIIQFGKRKEIIFVIGQDLFHHDNFKSMTSNGTIIANASMPKAVEDAKSFYYPLIELAAKHANRVKIIYSKGNHDESMAYMFVQMLQERFPNMEFDNEVTEYKVHVFGSNFVGFTHGDKMPRKEITRLFTQKFPMEWSQTTCREVHAGDLHREDLMGKDEWGIMFRTLSTKNRPDDWHKDKGFTTAHKRFMLFEYSLNELEAVRYV